MGNNKKKTVEALGKFTEQNLSDLESVAGKSEYKFSKEDFEAIKSGSATDKIQWRARTILSKIEKERKKLLNAYQLNQKNQMRVLKQPITKGEAMKHYCDKNSFNEFTRVVRALIEVLADAKIIGKKDVEKKYQEMALEAKHPDPCPVCTLFKDKKCTLKLMADEGEEKKAPVLAKEKFPDLTGKLAKRVIGCDFFEQVVEEEGEMK